MKDLEIEINKFKTFDYQKSINRIRNLRFADDTNMDEFVQIEEMLQSKELEYEYDKNFDIKIVN